MLTVRTARAMQSIAAGPSGYARMAGLAALPSTARAAFPASGDTATSAGRMRVNFVTLTSFPHSKAEGARCRSYLLYSTLRNAGSFLVMN